MANVGLFNRSPTAGGVDGTLVSGSNPIEDGPLLADGAAVLGEPIKLAVRVLNAGYYRPGSTTLTWVGATADAWSLAPDDNGDPGTWGDWGDPLSIAGPLENENIVFWVRPRSLASEDVTTTTEDTGVLLQVEDDVYYISGRSLALPYGVRETVGRSLALPSIVLNAVGRSLALPYEVQSDDVGRSLAIPYVVNGAVGRSLSLPYGVTGATGRSLVLPYVVSGAPTISQAILALNPLVYYDLQETSGTALDDKGSLNNDATASGTPTLNQSGPKSGHKSIYMDSGDRILAPNSSSLRFTGTSAFSACAWVNLDAVTGAVRNFISQDKNDVGYAGWQISFDTDGKIICYRLNSGNTPTYEGKLSTAVVAATGWHLYSVTFDGSNWRYYRDLTKIGSDVASTYTVSATSTQQFKIGNFSADIGNSPLMGYIAHAAVFGFELSAADLLTIYNGV